MSRISQFVRRHVASTTVAAVAVVALAGGGIAYAATSSGGPAKRTASPTTAPAPTAKGKGTKTHHHVTRGTVTAINGDTWTVKTAEGSTVTVTIDASTKFGTKKHPATQSSFHVGSSIAVGGSLEGSAISARHILVPQSKKSASTSPTSTTTAA